LQDFTAGLVKDQSAGVVVIEVATGNVLALVSMPGYDPDSFSTGITNDIWKALSADKKSPLLNKAIAGQFPPGSIFKMMVGLAALEDGAITESSTVSCPGYFMLGDHRFNCWKEGGHGTVNYQQALQHSCDTFFYTVGQRVGAEKYMDMARRFGFGHTHDIGIPGEKSGVAPDAAWKEKTYRQKWTGGDTINCAIGQGYVLATPLQLGVMAARIAGGNAVEPRLTIPAGQEKPVFEALDVDDDGLKLTREGMNMVVNEVGGTAYATRIADPNYAFGGKTGTSQVRKITVRGQNQNSIPWEFRHHAHFVAFSPVENPRYAIAVTIEHGGGGAATAAPVAKDILLKMQEIEGVVPTPEPDEDKKI
jgi:penicillin-binding protein 2